MNRVEVSNENDCGLGVGKNRCVAIARLISISGAKVGSADDVGIGGLLVAIESLKRFSGSDKTKSVDAIFVQEERCSILERMFDNLLRAGDRASTS
jgi:hypothetical protein